MFDNTNLFGERFQKSILIFLFSLFTVALIMTWMKPATGFESSIYASTPLVLWIALLSGELVGISLIVLSLSRPDFGKSNLWKFGLLYIFLGYATILNLYIIRGYYAWCLSGDPASHLGWINDIILTGHLPSSLIYPGLHIFTAEISLITSLSPLSLHRSIPVFFALICVAFTYLFVRTLSPDPVLPLIAGGIISCPFVFNFYTNLTPNSMADMFIPLALFLMFKYLQENKGGWGILFCIVLILYPVFHPLPAIFIGIVLLTLWMAPALREVWVGFREGNADYPALIRKNINRNVVIPFLILLLWFIFWYSSFSLWGNTIADIYHTISAEGRGPTSLSGLTSQISYAQVYGYNVLEIFLKTWGGPVLVSVLSVLAFPLLWVTTRQLQKKENLFSLYGPWAIVCAMVPVLYLFNLNFGPLRLMSYVAILAAIFVSALASYLILNSRSIKDRGTSWLISIIIIVLLFTLFLSGWSSIYPSPFTYSQSFQNSKAEFLGVKNFIEYRDVSVPVVATTLSFYRFVHLFLPPDQRERQNAPDYKETPNPPWHYGYDQNPSIASSFDTETDLILQKRDIVLYVDYFPNMQKYRFYPEDFIRVKNDPGANLVYSNGEFDLLTIKGQNQGGAV
jgi:hypothetical protein